MVTEALDFKYILIDNYKKMKISETELATIFVIDQLINQGNPIVTADLLSLKMSLDVKEIDKILATLLTRGFIEYVTKGKKTVTTLNPLKEKLYHEFELSLSKEALNKSLKETEEQLNNIYAQFEELLARPLSPIEVTKIGEWVSQGYDDETIINALKESLSKGKKSIRNVDKILLAWSTREDLETEGHTTIDFDWDKDLEETIRIAKTPWLDDDDK